MNGPGPLSSPAFNGGTISNPLIETANGAASTPAMSLTGTWFTGGTATTTKPQFLIEPAGTASTNWSTSGTGVGVNAAAGFGGNLIDLQIAGVSQFSIDTNGGSHFPSDGSGTNMYGGGYAFFFHNNLHIMSVEAYIRFAPQNIERCCIVSDDFSNGILNFRGIFSNGAAGIWVANTWTDANNYEEFAVDWTTTANVCKLRTVAKGTGTLRGLNIGGATTDLVGFFGVTPIVQPSTTGTTTGFTQGTGTIAMSTSTYTGNTGATAYTVGDIVNALKKLGLMAA